MPRTALLLLLCFLAGQASAQAVHRCVDPAGRSVYSDQPCASLGAVSRAAPRPSAVGNVHGFTTGTGTVAAGCSRSLDSLMLGVRGALEARDVNRLATFYHWPGTSSRGGRTMMDELEDIARRPLVAVHWVMPVPDLPEVESATDPLLALGPEPLAPAHAPGPGTGQATAAVVPVSQAVPRAAGQRPVALRIEQATSARDPGAQRTDFLLRRHAGCWWIEL